MIQYVELVAWSSFSSKLVQRDHPTLREGLSAHLAPHSICEYDKELVCLPQYIHLIDLVRGHLELSWLLYPILQNIFGVASTIEKAKQRGHENHGLAHLMHINIVSCLDGCKLRPTDISQGHSLGVSVRDDPVNHIHTWEHRVSA